MLALEPNVSDGIEVILVVECKHAVRPWIVRCMTNAHTPGDMARELMLHLNAISPLARALDEGALGDEIPFVVTPPRLLGFNIVEGPQSAKEGLGRRDREAPYAALQSVVAAARSISGRKSIYDSLWAVLPILVVEGSLWTLRDTTDAELERTSWQRVSWDGASDGKPVLVDVVDAEHLPTYLARLREDTQWLAGWMKRQPLPGPLIA